MEHYNKTDETKSGEITIERPCQFLLIGVSALATVADERISIRIQSASENNQVIATKVKLIDMFALSQHTEEMGFLTGGMTYFNIMLSDGGSVYLEEDEKLIVEFDDLAAALTYSVNSISGKDVSTDFVRYETKQLDSQHLVKGITMDSFDRMVINGFDHITKATITFLDKENRVYTPLELYALERMENNIAYEDADSLEANLRSTLLTLSIDEVDSIEFEKSADQVDFTFLEI